MKSIFSIIMLALISCCGETTEEKFKRECPYKDEYVGAFHQLQVPINIIPNKLKFNIGDTINATVSMNEMIYDLNTEQKFKILNFPFKPFSILYNFTNDITWEDGFHNVIQLTDASSIIRVDDNGQHPQALLLNYNFKENKYYLNLKMVLMKKGKYILQLQDGINDIRSDSEEYKKISSFDFDGKCPTFSYMPIQSIVGNDNMEHFEKELLHIDKTDFFDNWYSNKTEYGWQNPYGDGAFCFEQNATFGFIVE